MRIREMQVHRFRQHLDAHYVFDEGLNVIVGPNESGKSSLQMAILFALFGNPRHTTLDRKIKVDDYATWGANAPFAIELDFDAAGGSYHLAKDWQAGTARLELPEGAPLTDADAVQQTMEVLIGCVSSGLYMNTACVRQDDLASITDGQAAIGAALLQRLSSADEPSLADVTALLDKSVSAQKNKGNKAPGSIVRIPRELDTLSQEMARIRPDADRVHEAREELAELQARHSEIAVALKEQEAIKEALARSSRWEAQQAQAQQDEVALEDSLERIDVALKRQAEAAALEVELQAFGVEGLNQEVNNASTRAEVAAEQTQALSFEFEDKQCETNEILAELDRRRDELESVDSAVAEKKPVSFVALIAGAVLLIVGGLLYSSNHTLGPVIAVTGGIILSVQMILQRQKAAKVRAVQEQRKTELVDIEMQRTHLHEALEEVRQALAKANEAESKAQQNVAQLLARTGAASLADFTEKNGQYQQAHQTRLLAQTELETLLQGRPREELETARRNASKVRRDALEALEDESIAAVVDMSAAERQRIVNQIEALEEQADELDDKLIRCQTIIEHAGDADTRLLDLEARQQSLQEQLKRAEDWLSVCQIAQEVMQEAGVVAAETVRERLEPVISDSLHMLTEHYVQARVNADLSVEVYDAAADRWLTPETGTLSEGTVDQVYLISRLAMVQALFDDDTPPVMLDDPFVTFDAVRRAKALALCRELASKYQILLFTCHADLATADDHVIELI